MKSQLVKGLMKKRRWVSCEKNTECNPGELLLFNGLVVGKIFDKDVKTYVKDKKIERIQGVQIKTRIKK